MAEEQPIRAVAETQTKVEWASASSALVQTSLPEANIVAQAGDGDPKMAVNATQFVDEVATTSRAKAEAPPPEANMDTDDEEIIVVDNELPEIKFVAQAGDGDPKMAPNATKFNVKVAITSRATAEAPPPEANMDTQIDTQSTDEDEMMPDATKVGKDLAETDYCSETDSKDSFSTCVEDASIAPFVQGDCVEGMLESDEEIVVVDDEPPEGNIDSQTGDAESIMIVDVKQVGIESASTSCLSADTSLTDQDCIHLLEQVSNLAIFND